MRCLLSILAALATVCALAGAARAGSVPLGPAPSDLWQVGPDVYRADLDDSRPNVEIWRLSRVAGKHTQVMASVRTAADFDQEPVSRGEVEFLPGSRAVGVVERDLQDTGTAEWGDMTFSFGPYGAKPRVLGGCSSDDIAPQPPVAAVRDATIAYVAPLCAGSTEPVRVIIHDADGGPDRTVPAGPAGTSVAYLAIAGAFVAYESAGSITVADRSTGTVVYRVAAGGPFVLQEDGKVAWWGAPICPAPLDWASPADPRPHRLQVAACAPASFAGDRIVYQTETSTRAVTLTGADRELLPFDLPMSVDGSRIAFEAPDCPFDPAYEGSLDDPALAPFVPTSCPLRITKTRLAVRRRTVRIPLYCPRGCRGDAVLYVGRHGHARGDFSVTRRGALVIHLDRRIGVPRRGSRRRARIDIGQLMPDNAIRDIRRTVVLVGT